MEEEESAGHAEALIISSGIAPKEKESTEDLKAKENGEKDIKVEKETKEEKKKGKRGERKCSIDQVPYAFTKKYETDKWVPKYDRKAIKSYHKYADQICVKGESITQNLALAQMWFSLASSKAHADADKKIQE